MRRFQIRVLLSLLAAALAGFVIWGVYLTLIAGTTPGPDFIEAVQSGNMTADRISSIDVVQTDPGFNPFTEAEYGRLQRLAKIDSPAEIKQFLSLVSNAQPGHLPQNHPGTMYRIYLRVNTQGSYYWLYCNLLRDYQGAVLEINANTRNATNPNSGSYYYLKDYSVALEIIQRTKE